MNWGFSQTHISKSSLPSFWILQCILVTFSNCSFSYEGQKNILKSYAEGRDADSDVGLRDDAVRIHMKYCKTDDETGTLLEQYMYPSHGCSCTGLNVCIKAGFLKLL